MTANGKKNGISYLVLSSYSPHKSDKHSKQGILTALQYSTITTTIEGLIETCIHMVIKSNIYPTKGVT